MNLFKKHRTIADSYFYGSIFNIMAIMIFMIGFQYAASQQEHTLQTQPTPDGFQTFMTSGGAVITLILGLGALAGLIIGVFRKVQSNMTKEAKGIIEQYGKDAKVFFDNERKEQEKAREQQKEQIQNVASNLCNQITSVNNNVDSKFNTTKEKIDEIKGDVKDIKDEITESNKDSVKNSAILGEHERRISVLESNRFSAGGPMTGGFSVK